MTLDPRETLVLAALRTRLEALLGPSLVRLTAFGSRARGTASPNSDLDVLILVDELPPGHKRAIAHATEEVNQNHDFTPCLAPLIMGQPEFDEMVRRERRLVLDILREGVPV